MKKSTVLLLLLTFVVTNCSKDEGGKSSLLELPNISVIDVSQDFSWDYWVIGKQEYYYVEVNSLNSAPKTILYQGFEKNIEYTIFLKDNGFVDKVLIEDYILIFRNYNNNFVDVGIISPNGEINNFREIETNYNWENLSSKSSVSKTVTNWADIIRQATGTLEAVSCIFDLVTARGWHSLIGITESCTLLFSQELQENGLHNNFTEFTNTYSEIKEEALRPICYTPGNGSLNMSKDCFLKYLEDGLNLLANHLDHLENRGDDILICQGALENGYGDIQVTLTWDDGADLDIHVIDTNGEEIYYAHPNSVSGGVLDVDDIDGFGPENIYWPSNQAPSGNYQVFVHNFNDNGNGASNYTVLINAFGNTKKYTGSLVDKEIDQITWFSPNGFTSKSVVNPKTNITTSISKD